MVHMCRQVERVHAAVLGAHERHACLLPLEMYLEEGIPLVCHIRDQGHAQMVELPEQSCHAFISFANAQSPEPSLKVGSKRWELFAVSLCAFGQLEAAWLCPALPPLDAVTLPALITVALCHPKQLQQLYVCQTMLCCWCTSACHPAETTLLQRLWNILHAPRAGQSVYVCTSRSPYLTGAIP